MILHGQMESIGMGTGLSYLRHFLNVKKKLKPPVTMVALNPMPEQKVNICLRDISKRIQFFHHYASYLFSQS
jgi:hypothetical protein